MPRRDGRGPWGPWDDEASDRGWLEDQRDFLKRRLAAIEEYLQEE